MVLNFLKIFIAIITYVFSLTNFEYVDYLKFYIKLYIRSECSYPLSNPPDEFYKILVVRGGVRQRVLRY